MDPLSQYLSPFLPLALLVAGIVAFVREQFATTDPKTKEKKLLIDGKARVLPLVGLVSFGVVVWSQYHANPSAALNWLHIASETPAVFFLAAGGATFIQRLKDRSRFTFLEDTTALDESIGQLKEQMRSIPFPSVEVHVTGSVRPKDAGEMANAPTVSPPNQDGSVRVVTPITGVLSPDHPGSIIVGALDDSSEALAKVKEISVPIEQVREALGTKSTTPADKGAGTPDEPVKP